MDFTDKVVLVTGSSTGIGKAVAIKFAQRGAKVVINSRSSVADGQAVVEEISKMGQHAIYIQADVSEPEQVKQLFAQAREAFGRLDVLVNNAGGTLLKPFLETTKEDWLKILNVNLISAVLCSQEAARVMKAQGSGSIINTSSVRGLEHVGVPVLMTYSAAKASLNNFTRTLAKELAPQITVNAVALGMVETPLMLSNFKKLSEEKRNEMLGNTLIKRLMKGEEIAEAFLLLASSPVTTGEVLVVDGGFSLLKT